MLLTLDSIKGKTKSWCNVIGGGGGGVWGTRLALVAAKLSGEYNTASSALTPDQTVFSEFMPEEVKLLFAPPLGSKRLEKKKHIFSISGTDSVHQTPSFIKTL